MPRHSTAARPTLTIDDPATLARAARIARAVRARRLQTESSRVLAEAEPSKSP